MSSNYVELHFESGKDKGGKEIRDDLSAIVSVDKYLFLASDETTTIERLETNDGGKTFTNHQQFPLSNFGINLPSGSDEEVDIEGLYYDGRYIWIVGSHSLKRKKPDKDEKSSSKNIAHLLEVPKIEGKGLNRYLLARIPLAKVGSGYVLSASCPDPHDSGKTITASQLEITENGNILIQALSANESFKHFAKIPSKDNGIDIEGLAVVNNKIFLGLRGPVLRGWAIILELELESSNEKLELKTSSSGDLYKKHFLELGGLGVRDLLFDGQDLLVLAGPTMELDGPVEIFRWRNAANKTEETLTWQSPKELSSLQLNIPYGQGEDRGKDHAEGITFLTSRSGERSLLVIYDSPSDARKKLPTGNNSVKADLFLKW
jgi:Protein of unknown function (DUF3616)